MTRKNPSGGTWLVVGIIGVAGYLWLSRKSGGEKGVTPAGVTVWEPADDIAARMLYAWEAGGSPMDEESWVGLESHVLGKLTTAQLRVIYRQVIGFHSARNSWPTDATVKQWIIEAQS